MYLCLNSSLVNEDSVFLVNKENEKYVGDAIKKGVKKIITELDNDYEVETIHVKSVYDFIKEYYMEKLKDIKLIGITGTNGKTTTCYLIYQILNMMNVKTAYIGTIGFYINNEIKKLDNTTPTIDILYDLLLNAINEKCEVVVMEVSSHALKQNRVYGLLFDAIAITNITIDHLDYHKNMKDYVSSKKKLINMTKNKKICLLNKKDKYYKEFINKDNTNIVVGKNIKIKKIINYLDNTVIYIKDNKIKKYKISLVGKFNVYNFLYAYYIIKYLGYDMSCIDNKINLIKEPPGRMQMINYKDNVIFIDYAHTPDAVKKVLQTVKKIKNNGIITVIGCGGNRDKSKRKIMASIACKYSSYVIFTNDNPRLEDEKEIMKDILAGASGKYIVIYDRKDAIKKATKLLKGKMILLILGKGHEDYQIIGNHKFHFSDKEVVEEIIKK